MLVLLSMGDVLSNLDRVECPVLAAHHLSHVERLRVVSRLLLPGSHLADPIDDLGAAEQLRARKAELLVWAKCNLLLVRRLLGLELNCVHVPLLRVGRGQAWLARILIR